MGYKPTGKPPGRPRKASDVEAPAESFGTSPAIASGDIDALQRDNVERVAKLSRAHAGFRRAFPDPAANLHKPPRFGPRRQRHVGKRPMLHPNVIAAIAKAAE